MSPAPAPLAELDDVAVVFDALAHPARRQVLLVLLARGESMTSKDVAERFSTTWATVSRHLKTLESAGLVRVVDSDDGRERLYQLDRERLLGVTGRWLGHFEASGSGGSAVRRAPPRPGRSQARS